MKTATRARNRARTITALQNLAANYAVAPKMRQAAALRLSRLRAATTPAATTPAITPRAAKPAAPAAPSEKAVYEAVQSFHALSRQRTALSRKHRTPAMQDAFLAISALLPAAVPTSNDPQPWINFVQQIDGLLAEIKNVRPL
jgi:hypothetical protein